jgi:beta-glucosidase
MTMKQNEVLGNLVVLLCATLAMIVFPNRMFAADKMAVADPEKVITNLLAHMTVEEKVLQLQARDPNGVPRLGLGVPNLHVGEALHGVVYPGATAFPQAIALGSTWSPDLIEQVAGVIAKEARAVGMHQVFGPMLGLAQDARWGRVEESYGEDPYLVSRIGVAYINGLQGRGAERFDRNHIIATAKHFAADGLPLTGQNGGAIEISERALRETHLRPFEAAVKEAHVGAIMPAHHAINGVPCHANAWLLDDLLRKEWGFDGYIVSDFGDIYNLSDNPEIISQHVVATPAAAALLALECGVDMELAPGTWDDPKRVYAKTLLDEVQAGRVPMTLIDRAASRVLRAKLALGLRAAPDTNSAAVTAKNQLSQPDVDDGAGDLWGRLVRDGQLNELGEDRRADAEQILNDSAHDALALKAAQKAIVLLKNEGDLLPLQKEKIKRIAVVGPLATNVTLGGYSTPRPKFYVNVVEGLKAQFGGAAKITFAPGCELETDSPALLPAAVDAARAADVVICVVGSTRKQMGENLDRDNLDLVGGQEKLVEAVHATGKPVVVVLLNGGPISIPWIKKNIPAIVEGWYLGQATGTALAQVLTGEINPGGKLPVTIPQNVGRVPAYYYRPPAARRMNYYQSPGGDLFPFGHGLSYTKFTYSDLKISPEKFSTNQTATVSLKLTNSGARTGDEVVQLYLHDDVSSLVRPAKELRGFERVTLAPGESREVKFPVGFDHLKFWKNGGWVVEPGTFTVMVGSSSEDIRLKGWLEIMAPK